MKKLLYLFMIAVLMGCQKAELVDGGNDEGRASTEERTDSVYVSPKFEAEGWEGAVDVEFTF